MRAAIAALVCAAGSLEAHAAGFMVLDAQGDANHAQQVAQALRAANVEAASGHPALEGAPKPVTGVLEHQLAAVKAGYVKFDLAKSEQAYAQAMEFLSEAGPWVTDRRVLTDLAVTGAAVAHARGDAPQTIERLRRALSYDRELAITALDFSPDFVALFESVRAEVRKAGTASTEVRSLPSGAQVYLDGRFVGASPLALPTDSLTEHFVRVELPGRVAWAGIVRGPLDVVLPRAPLTACPAGALASTAQGPLEAPCAARLAEDADLGVLVVNSTGEAVALFAGGRVFRDRFAGPVPTPAEVANLSPQARSVAVPVLAAAGVVVVAAAVVTGYLLTRPRDTTVVVNFRSVP